ncbi:hypothetical protein [Klebsiella sp. BIGb0407]|uniref:hypothetical protein n=1 Tax=Klebsiella sp. BIGb0407 TaxID=2940603 RepID=UPI0021675984|nr:hypothetical protein [Klebsiella sp. BIGb0407]MCS3433004.1 hypothetical protein [Klebsiella sp. BIGb0407]
MLKLYPERIQQDINKNLKLNHSDDSVQTIIKIQNSPGSSFSTINQPIKSRGNGFFNRFFNKIKNEKMDFQEYSRLIGITIHPKTVQKFQGKIEFNSTGEITSIMSKDITRKQFNLLIKNRIKPLAETPQIMKERIRTPGETIIDIGGLINKAGVELVNKHEIEELIKSTWLDGSLSKQSLYNTVELIKIKISESKSIILEIDSIVDTLEKDFFVTKRNDNYYGRLFETELSKYIIHNPDSGMLKVRDIVSEFILDNFSNMSEHQQIALCTEVAKNMCKDPPLWRSSLYHANRFIVNKKPPCFIDMIEFKGTNSVPLILSVAVKYIVLSEGTRDIKNIATKHYINKIMPQRQFLKPLSEKKSSFTTAYGLLLPWQKYHPAKNEGNPGFGIRPIDEYLCPSAGVALTEHDAAALANERAIGIGISGSANVLHFLFQYLRLRDDNFPLDEAKLATASWLSYSGGHSFNEAYSVFGFMTEGNFKPLSFNGIKSSSSLGGVAVAQAYNKVIEASVALSN